jgi:pimeloyl-ACP methyl ester carboxylesterase
MTEVLQVGAITLCAEAFGDPADPAILLVAGANSSMDSWEPEFCRRLAAGGRFVVRYDHRDTGQSVGYPPGAPGYTGDDLVTDAVGVLTAYGIDAAHVVGISMGGALAQLAALDHPDRVASLVLISTSAGAGDSDLPSMSDELRASFGKASTPDWSDRAAVVEYIVEAYRPYASRSRPFDEDGVRALAGHVFDRTVSIASAMTNHHAAKGSGPWRDRLGEIDVPTLVIHGDEDPLFPPAHGVALAAEIRGARMLRLPQTGHELTDRDWDVVVPAILAHTSGARVA